jgi:hypothetical protein
VVPAVYPDAVKWMWTDRCGQLEAVYCQRDVSEVDGEDISIGSIGSIGSIRSIRGGQRWTEISEVDGTHSELFCLWCM